MLAQSSPVSPLGQLDYREGWFAIIPKEGQPGETLCGLQVHLNDKSLAEFPNRDWPAIEHWAERGLLKPFFFLRLPIGQYGPVSQLSRSEERCTGPFNWGEAHCAGEKVKRKIGPFLRKSLKNQTRTRTQQKGAQPATATRNPLARLPGARAKEEKTTTNKRLHQQILVRLNVLDLQWTIL